METRIHAGYDMQQTCRSCLSQLDFDELISLDKPHDEIAGGTEKLLTRKTTGEIMMECANIEVNTQLINGKQHL